MSETYRNAKTFFTLEDLNWVSFATYSKLILLQHLKTTGGLILAVISISSPTWAQIHTLRTHSKTGLHAICTAESFCTEYS